MTFPSCARFCLEGLLGLEATDRDLPPFDEMLTIVRQERQWAKSDYAEDIAEGDARTAIAVSAADRT